MTISHSVPLEEATPEQAALSERDVTRSLGVLAGTFVITVPGLTGLALSREMNFKHFHASVDTSVPAHVPCLKEMVAEGTFIGSMLLGSAIICATFWKNSWPMTRKFTKWLVEDPAKQQLILDGVSRLENATVPQTLEIN